MAGTDGPKVVRGLFTCPVCKGVVCREAFRTGGTGYDQRGRYWHHDCYRIRKENDIRKNLPRNLQKQFVLSDQEYQWYLNRVQKVFVVVPSEEA